MNEYVTNFIQERTLTVGFGTVDGSCDVEAVDVFGFGATAAVLAFVGAD